MRKLPHAFKNMAQEVGHILGQVFHVEMNFFVIQL